MPNSENGIAAANQSAARQADQRKRLWIIGISFVVAVVLMATKFYAYWLTHSAALLSDALESIINVVASAFAFGSIIVAARPPDENHPYGHGKIEFFSAGFEGAWIVLAAVGIFATGITHLIHPHPIPNLGIGILLLIATMGVNLLLGLALVRVGKRTDSLTLVADGRHVLTDVITSGGVLVGLLAVSLTGWHRIDGAIACLVGVHILMTGFDLVRQSVHGLMDAASPALLQRIHQVLADHRRPCWVDIHQLRAWKSGGHVHVDLHLVLPRGMSMAAAHREAEVVERLIVDAFGGRASALIHMDPCADADCPVCRQNRCELRSAPHRESEAWRLETVTALRATRHEP